MTTNRTEQYCYGPDDKISDLDKPLQTKTTLPDPKNHKSELDKGELKPCKYPGCSKLYIGTGFSKYCIEHRKREYHKPVKKLKPDEVNIFHEHTNLNTVYLDFRCCLKGCSKSYKLTIIPGVFIYPKYCEEHRNEHKRSLFLKIKENENGTY